MKNTECYSLRNYLTVTIHTSNNSACSYLSCSQNQIECTLIMYVCICVPAIRMLLRLYLHARLVPFYKVVETHRPVSELYRNVYVCACVHAVTNTFKQKRLSPVCCCCCRRCCLVFLEPIKLELLTLTNTHTYSTNAH